MTSRKHSQNPFEGLEALQRGLGEVSTSLQTACMGAAQNASHFIGFLQHQRLHLLSRTAPFASSTLQFARATENSSKAKGKKRSRNDDGSASAGKSKQSEKTSLEPTISKQETEQVEEKKPKEPKKLTKRQLAEQKRQEAEKQRAEAEVKRQKEEEKQREAARVQKEKVERREEQKMIEEMDKYNRWLRRLADSRRSRESEFVRSLEDVELTEEDYSPEITGMKHVYREDFTEEHDEMMREILREGGHPEAELEEMTLEKLLNDEEKARKRKEMSADEPGIRNRLREDIYNEMRGEDLRPHAEKMELRVHEHEALELDCLGKGHFTHDKKILGLIPYGVVHDFSWGLFGQIPVIRDRLGPKWGGKDPDIVMQNQAFYDDILNIAPEMEMTVMMVAERDIPLWELRNKFLDNQHIKLRQILYKEDELKPLEHKHKVLLAKIKIAAMEDFFIGSGLMDKKGNIKENTKLILVVTDTGALTAEAVTPGTIAEQKVVRLGRWTDTTFARSVMDNFLGLYPKDQYGKTAVGNGALYVANGFDYRPPLITDNPYQFYDSPPRDDVMDILSKPSPQEGFEFSPQMFSVEKEQPFVVKDLDNSKVLKEYLATAEPEVRNAILKQ